MMSVSGLTLEVCRSFYFFCLVWGLGSKQTEAPQGYLGSFCRSVVFMMTFAISFPFLHHHLFLGWARQTMPD